MYWPGSLQDFWKLQNTVSLPHWCDFCSYTGTPYEHWTTDWQWSKTGTVLGLINISNLRNCSQNRSQKYWVPKSKLFPCLILVHYFRLGLSVIAMVTRCQNVNRANNDILQQFTSVGCLSTAQIRVSWLFSVVCFAYLRGGNNCETSCVLPGKSRSSLHMWNIPLRRIGLLLFFRGSQRTTIPRRTNQNQFILSNTVLPGSKQLLSSFIVLMKTRWIFNSSDVSEVPTAGFG